MAWVALAAGAWGCSKSNLTLLPEPDLEEGPARRASWTADGMDLRKGDVVTIIVDERTAARERVSRLGSDRRTTRADLNYKTQTVGSEASGGSFGVNSKLESDSRDMGTADRQGDLTGVVSARVLAVDASGAALVQGVKTVQIDGRKQQLTIRGVVRSQDLAPGNVIHSSRLADATLTYDGSAIGPKRGIVGRLLSALWPF